MEVLLSFTGFHDPFAETALEGEQQAGPILTIVSERKFDRVCLFVTPKLAERSAAAKAAIEERHPGVEIELLEVPLADPTNYVGILRQLRKHFRALSRKHPHATYSISVSSGTPHMHACWVLLAASGEIPARILESRPPQFVPDGKSPVKEIDVTHKEFPQITRPLEDFRDFEGDEAQAIIDGCLRSVLIDMFGDPVTNPKGWKVNASGELFADKPRIGTTRPASGRGIPVVRVGEVGEEEIAFSRCGRVELDKSEFARFQLLPGDTVIARAIGSRSQLGKASFFEGHIEPVVVDSHVMRLRPNAETCNPYWFYLFLSSPAGKTLIQQQGGATAVQFNVNSDQASSLPVPLPPIDLQNAFAGIAFSLRTTTRAQRFQQVISEVLFASLQQRAFRGEL